MVNQRNPETRRNVLTASSGWGIWPLAIGIFALVVIAAYMLMGPRDNRIGAQQTSIEKSSPAIAPGTSVNPVPATPKN